jgi:uncharacterized membrane protein
MMKKSLKYTILFLALVALVFSILIRLEKTQAGEGLKGFCSSLSGGGCATVQASPYAALFGINLEFYGIAGFFLLTVLALYNLRWPNKKVEFLVVAGSIFAGIAAIGLIAIQAFVIGKFCAFCMVVDTTSIVIFAVVIYSLFSGRLHKNHS